MFLKNIEEFFLKNLKPRKILRNCIILSKSFKILLDFLGLGGSWLFSILDLLSSMMISSSGLPVVLYFNECVLSPLILDAKRVPDSSSTYG